MENHCIVCDGIYPDDELRKYDGVCQFCYQYEIEKEHARKDADSRASLQQIN